MRKTFFSIAAILTVLGLLFNVAALPLLPGVTAVSAADPVIVDNFENGLPTGVDANGVNIGFSTFKDSGSSVAISTATPPAPVPGIADPNHVLQLDVNVVGYAGFIHSFTDPGFTAWVPQNWSAYEGFELWVYGLNSGTGMFIDILDNRNPGSTKDDAERYTVSFTDHFSGWQLLQFPFASFVRKDVGNGAPNDGFGLTEVNGWAFGTVGTGGPKTFYMDNAALYGVAPFVPLKVTFSAGNFSVKEGGAGAIKVKLNRPMGDLDAAQVTVNYALEPGSAVAGRNYTPVANGTLTFKKGEPSEQAITVQTLRDYKRMGDLIAVARLSGPVGMDLGATIEAALVIQDAEAPDANLLDDFETAPYLWKASGYAVKLNTQEITPGSALALPGQ